MRKKKHNPIRVEKSDIPKQRKGWGLIKPFTKIWKDKKKEKSKKACRGKFRYSE